jgi:hypothetical protein
VTGAIDAWCNALIDTYFDDTIDGDRNNPNDLRDFLEPFLNTIILQTQP